MIRAAFLPAIWNMLRAALRYVLILTLLAGVSSVAAVFALRYVPPPASAFMLRAQWQAYMDEREYTLRYQWLDWNILPEQAALAVIAAEDQLFLQHEGFDFKAIESAWEQNQQNMIGPTNPPPKSTKIKSRRVRGASTITQQVAKNLFLWQEKSYLRKGLEAYFTVLIEGMWTKRRVLEMYLNIVQFGDGIYGITAASNHYFDKSPLALTPKEAALLAAVLPNPLILRADEPSKYVVSRRDWIVKQMRQLGENHLDQIK